MPMIQTTDEMYKVPLIIFNESTEPLNIRTKDKKIKLNVSITSAVLKLPISIPLIEIEIKMVKKNNKSVFKIALFSRNKVMSTLNILSKMKPISAAMMRTIEGFIVPKGVFIVRDFTKVLGTNERTKKGLIIKK